MDIKFNAQIAERLSLEEAIFIGWLQQHYTRKPILTSELEQNFPFWQDDTLPRVLVRLEERRILLTQRNQSHFCVFSLHYEEIQKQTGVSLEATQGNAPLTTNHISDANLKKHLQRFQSQDTVLNQKLSSLVNEQSHELIDYAQAEGLSSEVAKATLDKFLHYVSANPDRFWNADLAAYWRFWVSNQKDRMTSNHHKTTGKRTAIEQTNQHAAANWLKKKSQSEELHTSVGIHRK